LVLVQRRLQELQRRPLVLVLRRLALQQLRLLLVRLQQVRHLQPMPTASCLLQRTTGRRSEGLQNFFSCRSP
jgi:hypothetical protein